MVIKWKLLYSGLLIFSEAVTKKMNDEIIQEKNIVNNIVVCYFMFTHLHLDTFLLLKSNAHSSQHFSCRSAVSQTHFKITMLLPNTVGTTLWVCTKHCTNKHSSEPWIDQIISVTLHLLRPPTFRVEGWLHRFRMISVSYNNINHPH